MSTEQLPSGTSGNAPLYIIVSAATPASMSDDKCGKVLVTPQQPHVQAAPIVASSVFDKGPSTLCGSLPVAPVHHQVTLTNAVNHVAMSSKELPGQMSNQAQIRVIPSLMQTIGNENPQLTAKLQPQRIPHSLTVERSQPQPSQVQSSHQMTSQTQQARQQFQNVSNDSSVSIAAPFVLTNDDVGNQLLALLGALQQRQQQKQQQPQLPQQQQPPTPTPQQGQPPPQQQQQSQPPSVTINPNQPSSQQQQPQQQPQPQQSQPQQPHHHQQHQQQQQQLQSQPTPAQEQQQSHHLQHQPQHVIMTSPSEMQVVENAALPASALNHAILPNQLKQMQQSIQSGQDIGQVLQAVLSQTAAMQGNLTTILTAITTLMQQQHQQQQLHVQQQMKQEQATASVASPPQAQATPAPSVPEIVSQASSDATPAFSSACKPFTSCGVQLPTPTSLDSPTLSNSFLCRDASSQPITSISGMNSPAVHSSVSIFDPSVSFTEPLHSMPINSSQTSTVASNFAHDIDGSAMMPETPKPPSQPSSQPPTVPMDVDALLQQIFGDVPKHFDPVLGSTKFDVQDSLVSQTPVMSASVSNSHFVDSLLNQPLPSEGKGASNVERQSSQNNANGNNNSSGNNSSTLRSLLTENSWLSSSSKPNDSIIMNSDSVSSDTTSMYSNSNVSAGSHLYLPTTGNEHIAKPSPLNTTLDANEEDQVPHSSSGQLENNVSKQHHLLEVQPGSSIHHQHIDEVSNSSTQQQLNEQNYQEEHRRPLDEHNDQHQVLKLRKMEEESQQSVDFKPFNDPNDNSTVYSKGDLSLRKAREGDSSGDESSPSCSPSSSRCGSPYMSRNSPDFTASEVICQDSDTQMSVIRRYHDMHIGSCSDSAMDELTSIHGGTAGDQGLCLLPPGAGGANIARSKAAGGSGAGFVCAAGDEPSDAAEDDTDEMQPAAKQRRGINQTHVSDLCTTDEESNHGTYVSVTPWPPSSHVSSPTTLPADLSSDAGNAASPPLITSQTPRLSGSGASLIMPVSVPTSSEPVFPTTTSHRKIARLPSLSISFSPRNGPCELKILVQPEEQHRARYMTEGSRGAVKDRSGQGHPVVQLLGWNQTATLQVFVGTDVGRVKPHGFYQACKVSGKNSTPCKERNFDGTNVIEIQFDPNKDMKLSIDCVGILKLRNADVEQRVGLHKTKKSTKARMVFRVNVPRGDGSYLTLQTFTEPILCTQPIGSPEVSRISLMQASCRGGTDLFIIGKNFAKGTKVIFQELTGDGRDTLVWEKEAAVETEFLGQSHLICTIPPYRNVNITSQVQVQLVVKCNGRISEPHVFAYKPEAPASDQLAWNSILTAASNLPSSCTATSLANSGVPSASISSFVSPVAVELNKLVQVKNSSSLDFLGSQGLNSTLSSGAFSLPLSSPKVSSASPSAAGSVTGGPASVVSSGPDSVSSNPCVITGDSGCELNLISGINSAEATPRDGVGAKSTSVPASNASANTDSPVPEVGVEHMDWTKIELPADLTGNSDDFNFLTELSTSTVTDGTEETSSSLPQKRETVDQEARQNGPFFMQ